MKLRKRGEGWDLDSGRGGTSGGNKDKKADVDGCDWLTGDLILSFRFYLILYPYLLKFWTKNLTIVVSSCVVHESDPADYSLTSKPPRLTFSNPMQASGNFQCRNAEISTRE
ncbi:hypothetical protein V6N13_144122 [Hibiscus sabdariffa]